MEFLLCELIGVVIEHLGIRNRWSLSKISTSFGRAASKMVVVISDNDTLFTILLRQDYLSVIRSRQYIITLKYLRLLAKAELRSGLNILGYGGTASGNLKE